MATRRNFPHDPDARLDYYFDWRALANGTGDSDWLAAGETITDFEVGADNSLTFGVGDTELINGDTAVRVWVDGVTVGVRYAVACKITTSAGRIDERTIYIDAYER